MNVDGVITLAQADDVLTIPVDVLMRGNQVYVKDDSVTAPQGAVPAGFRAVQVETGLMNDSLVEITSGLSEGDTVYVAESTQTSGFMMMRPGSMGGGMGGPARRRPRRRPADRRRFEMAEVTREVEGASQIAMGQPLIELKDIYKIYHMGDEEVRANDGISLTICRGEFVAIVGKSGSGKSTLMNIIGALDVPTKGDYFLGGEDVAVMSDKQLARIRNKMIGFIFQQYNLLPKLNLLENVGASSAVRGSGDGGAAGACHGTP